MSGPPKIQKWQIEALKREIETADRVSFELSNGADEAYETAEMELAGYAIDNEGISPEKTKEIYALFEAYRSKYGGALDAACRKADAIQALFTALRHPIL